MVPSTTTRAASTSSTTSTNELEAGDETSRSYSLDPGNYVLLCNIVEDIDGTETSHYAQGMWTEFTVTLDE